MIDRGSLRFDDLIAQQRATDTLLLDDEHENKSFVPAHYRTRDASVRISFLFHVPYLDLS